MKAAYILDGKVQVGELPDPVPGMMAATVACPPRGPILPLPRRPSRPSPRVRVSRVRRGVKVARAGANDVMRRA